MSTTKPPLQPPRPSSSIVLLSPTNQVLLLHRVRTSTSFASAHVFPGGNLDPLHDGDIPGIESPERHVDGPSYRLGGVRECFEETGILLAKGGKGDELVNLDVGERDNARRAIHGREVKFGEWLSSINATADTENLIPFTRWITPTNVPKRFTTQMYLYLLPLSSNLPSESLVPTPDGGVEHTAATFADASIWLDRQAKGEIILFPPQAFLLKLIDECFEKGGTLQEQRDRLLEFVYQVPTAKTEKGKEQDVSHISWGDKVMSPHNLFVRQGDKRVVLGLDKPGPELKGSGRGGDWERVVLVRFGKGGPREVEIRDRAEVLEEERTVKRESNL